MKAMRLPRIAPVEQSPLEPADLPDPRPGPNEVVLDVEACGVCRTDLHIVEGEVAARLPIVPGHQVAGTSAAGRALPDATGTAVTPNE
jgi:propanol-preferring alcohol dehydrogenase